MSSTPSSPIVGVLALTEFDTGSNLSRTPPPRRILPQNPAPYSPDPFHQFSSPPPLMKMALPCQRPIILESPVSFHLPYHDSSPTHAPTTVIPRPSSSSLPPLLPHIIYPSLSDYEWTTIPHKPRPENRIAQSSFCPHVAATDCLYCWMTPYAIKHNQNVFSSLPPELAEHAHTALCGAHAPNTKSSYASGLLRFTRFCDK